ncbi:MAG: L,D-transpeptidase [Verrucomicrobia bacterium]|nr:L,D-transpeptidase [Verrucomicrobiota bacterium]
MDSFKSETVCGHESSSQIRDGSLYIEFIPKLSARQTQVIINLTEQTAYLLEDGQLAFVSPIASGKPGWGTPTGPRGRFRSIN